MDYDRDVSMLTQIERKVYDTALELIENCPSGETTSGEIAESADLELDQVLEALKTLGDKHLNLKDAEELGPGSLRVRRDHISGSAGTEDSNE